MPPVNRTVPLPTVIEVRHAAIDQLGEILTAPGSGIGTKAAVVVGPGIGARVGPRALRAMDGAELLEPIVPGTLDAALALSRRLAARPYDAVVAVGGGRVIDTAKYAASHAGIPMVAVATSLAHDGIASPVSVLTDDGASGSYGVAVPRATVVDLDYARRAPLRCTRSGIGDALSNLSAVADWELAARHRGELLDGLAAALARAGAQALLRHPGGVTDDSFLACLANALVLGGVAMAVAGSSRPCSGGCHEISHAVDRLYPGTSTHGEQVGVGALFCTFLRGETDRLAALRDALHRHGLAVRPQQLGLSVAQFTAAVAAAPRTRPDRYTILEHLSLPDRELAIQVRKFADAMA